CCQLVRDFSKWKTHKLAACATDSDGRVEYQHPVILRRRQLKDGTFKLRESWTQLRPGSTTAR
ncbi:MAG: hypothetical protein AABP62_26695, partial [Planctomycetota bacterium]